jgi:peptidoglycan/xylan/chitin deacetylase (PgdA/CDA1 family)
MTIQMKRAVLHLAKWTGLFHLARRLTPGGLTILCYHGVSMEEEHRFRPQMFITRPTFDRRLRYLANKRFPVLALADALDRLAQGTLPPGAAVITVDEGLYSFGRYWCERLEEFAFPVTVYVTSYYCIKQNPVFRLAVQYMFWKSRRGQLDLTGLDLPMSGRVSLEDESEKTRIMWQIIECAESRHGEPRRRDLAEAIGQRLGVSYDRLVRSRCLSLMTLEELADLARSGVDLQLHTHRHRFPVDEVLATREITDNQAALKPVAKNEPEHLCYPSGEWSERHWPWMAAAGIKSATTTTSGPNYRDTPRYALRRFMDGEAVSQIEFEAEVCGFAEILRQARAAVRRVTRGDRCPSGRGVDE